MPRSYGGAGIDNAGDLYMTGSRLFHNQVAGTTYSDTADPGGGLLNRGVATVEHSVIQSNWAGSGSGIRNAGDLQVRAHLAEQADHAARRVAAQPLVEEVFVQARLLVDRRVIVQPQPLPVAVLADFAPLGVLRKARSLGKAHPSLPADVLIVRDSRNLSHVLVSTWFS